jgi:pimeloyl-ACP methyl ester carboxylesterase
MDFFDKDKSRQSACDHILNVCLESGVFSNWIEVRDPHTHQNIKIHFITNRLINIPYTDFDDSATPIYILHGSGGSAIHYTDIMNRFKDERLVVAIDIPGYGISDNPTWHDEKAQIIFDNIGAIIISTIKRITGDKKVVAVGLSIGSYFYISAMRQEPRLFRQAILIATPGVFPTLGKYGYYWGLMFSYNIPFNILSHPLLRIVFYPISKLLLDRNIATMLNNTYSNGINYLKSFIHLINNKMVWTLPQLDTVLSLPIPLAFVYGGKDTIIPYHQGHVLCRVHPHIYTYILKDGGHIIDADSYEFILRDQLARKDLIYKPGLKCENTLRGTKDICSGKGEHQYYATFSLSHTISIFNKCYDNLYKIVKDCNHHIHKTIICPNIERYQTYANK